MQYRKIVIFLFVLFIYGFPKIQISAQNGHAPKPEPYLECVYKVKPAYPQEALRQNIKGKVFLELTINGKGRVIDAIVLDSPNDMFNKPSIKAVMKWRYKIYGKLKKHHKYLWKKVEYIEYELLN